MMVKVPSNDWSAEQFEYIIEDDESISDFEDDPDFTEYLWMENEEEFDKIEMQRLEEEYIMRECIEAMLEDELEFELAEIQQAKEEELNEALADLTLTAQNVAHSMLNPLADVFVPKTQKNVNIKS